MYQNPQNHSKYFVKETDLMETKKGFLNESQKRHDEAFLSHLQILCLELQSEYKYEPGYKYVESG